MGTNARDLSGMFNFHPSGLDKQRDVLRFAAFSWFGPAEKLCEAQRHLPGRLVKLVFWAPQSPTQKPWGPPRATLIVGLNTFKQGLSRPIPQTSQVVHQPGDGNCLFHSLAYGLGKASCLVLLVEK